MHAPQERWWWTKVGVSLATLALVALGGCRDRRVVEDACAPGAVAPCTCEGGATSRQTCTALGRFGPCACEIGWPDGGAPTPDADAPDAPDAPAPTADPGPADADGAGDAPAPRWTDVPALPARTRPGAGPVTRNPACSPAIEELEGAKVAWNGFTYGGTTFTCNNCPGGMSELRGAWRLMDFATGDPEVPLAGGDRERLEFDGNTWQQLLDDTGPDGQRQQARAGGWYFCATKPEHENELKVFVVTWADPVGAFDLSPGVVWAGQPLLAQNANAMALEYHSDVFAPALGFFVYCRIGAIIEVEDCGNGHACMRKCLDPFAP